MITRRHMFQMVAASAALAVVGVGERPAAILAVYDMAENEIARVNFSESDIDPLRRDLNNRVQAVHEFVLQYSHPDGAEEIFVTHAKWVKKPDVPKAEGIHDVYILESMELREKDKLHLTVRIVTSKRALQRVAA